MIILHEACKYLQNERKDDQDVIEAVNFQTQDKDEAKMENQNKLYTSEGKTINHQQSDHAKVQELQENDKVIAALKAANELLDKVPTKE